MMKNIIIFNYRQSFPILTFGLVVLLLIGVMQSDPTVAITKTGEIKKIPMYMITTREKLNYEGIEGTIFEYKSTNSTTMSR
jgi:hypothetical protein